MIKNKTLKGLAISAVVALGLSGFAAAPASANYGLADKSFVSLAPSAGDEYSVFADGTFVVAVSKAQTLNQGTLKLLVEDVSGNVTSTDSAVAAVAPVASQSGTSTVVANRDGDGVARKSATDGSFVLAASNSAALSATFSIDAKAIKTIFSSSFEVKVTAWNDANLDGVIQPTEYASPTQTIKFVDADDVALSVTLNRPVVGVNSTSALVSFTPTLNHEQGSSLDYAITNAQADVVFTRGGFPATESEAANTWNATDRYYTVYSKDFNDVGWGIPKPSAVASLSGTASIAVTGGTATFETAVASNVAVGDSFLVATASETTRTTVSKIVSVTKFEGSVAAATPSLSATAYTASSMTILTDDVVAGEYTARGYWKNVAGALSGLATLAVVSSDVELTLAGSANVQGLSAQDADSTVLVRAGTTTLDITATVVDVDGDAVGAGRAVVVSNASRTADVRVNGKTGADTLLTDANGQVKVTVTSTAGASTAGVQLTFTPEGVTAAATAVTLDWAAAVYALADLSVANATIATTRAITSGSSYTVDLAVLDQWFQAPAATSTYRLVVTGGGATNAVLPMTGGKATVTIGDNGTATAYSTVLTLQKLGTTGTYGTESTTTMTTNVGTGAVVLGADKTSLFASPAVVALSSAVAAKALVEADLRVAETAIPEYKNNAVISGKVRVATTGLAVNGASVTVTGPSNMLFKSGDKVYKRGSVTLIADSSGEFSVEVFSTTAQKDTVVTVTSMGNSATTKLTFTGIGVGEGTSLVITAPDNVEPASTVQVKAKLTDAFGNAVTAAAGRMKVTYTGPGIIFGTLPTATDTAGELMFSALLGAADKGTITVVVSYDQNGDGDFVDAKDLNTTKVITVGAAAAAPASDQKLTVGSFKGFVAIYALNYTGQKLSAKVAGKWLVENNLARFERVVRLTGAAIPIVVDLYIDGTFVRTENIVTK